MLPFLNDYRAFFIDLYLWPEWTEWVVFVIILAFATILIISSLARLKKLIRSSFLRK